MRNPRHIAILQTLHYADIFAYPLTRKELARFLIGIRASPQEIDVAVEELEQGGLCSISPEGFITLPGRERIVRERMRLKEQAQRQKPRARLYARVLGFFPFVRMVALTGALAMENARDEDIDLFIVCSPGHLWTVRGVAVLLVRLARLRGDELCPNFLVTEDRLGIAEENLYNAHEILQMISLYGHELYARFRQVNCWAESWLPNAAQQPGEASEPHNVLASRAKRLAERLLSGKLAEAIEQWEMSRKVKKLASSIAASADDVEFSAQACRGFTSGHGRRVLREFESRCRELDLAPSREPDFAPAILQVSIPGTI